MKPDDYVLPFYLRPTEAQLLCTSKSDTLSVALGMVVPPFGFGIGDFLAVAKLTGKIVSELKDVRH